MCICDSSYPRKLAFSYLDELSKEFQRSYEGKIDTVTRPYAFMGFGLYKGTHPEPVLTESLRYLYLEDDTVISRFADADTGRRTGSGTQQSAGSTE